ncbi:MAG: hypothetical protein GY888_29285, partial [Planctomycetaceae bacterium]|nr:hypothetical protein [Planctomycetaceae bacterium]
MAPGASESTLQPVSHDDGFLSQVQAEFNQRNSIRDVLVGSDWKYDERGFFRPGAESGQISAHVNSNGRLKVFSTSAEIPVEGTHDAFSCFCHLNHNGNRLAAAQAESDLVDTLKGFDLRGFTVNGEHVTGQTYVATPNTKQELIAAAIVEQERQELAEVADIELPDIKIGGLVGVLHEWMNATALY